MSLTDERVQFYLRHRDQIEEWALLRRDAALAIDVWLEDLAAEAQTLAELLWAVVLTRTSDTGWPGFFLRRSTWPDDSGESVGIGLEWVRGKTNLVGAAVPYVGVRSPRTTRIGTALRADTTLMGRVRQRKENVSSHWLAYTRLPPERAFPDHTDAYRERLLDGVRNAWATYAPDLDRVTAALLRPGGDP